MLISEVQFREFQSVGVPAATGAAVSLGRDGAGRMRAALRCASFWASLSAFISFLAYMYQHEDKYHYYYFERWLTLSPTTLDGH